MHNIKITLTDTDTGETIDTPCSHFGLSVDYRPDSASYFLHFDIEGGKRYEERERQTILEKAIRMGVESIN